jgi:hypothetical protein
VVWHDTPPCHGRQGPPQGGFVIVIAGLGLGAAMGASVALRRGGKVLDALQYAAGYGIAFGLLGLFATIFLERML